MVAEIRVSLSFRGSAVTAPQPTPVGSSAGQLTNALQVAAQRTNDLLTNLIDSGQLSTCTGGAAVGVEEDEDSDEDEDLSEGFPEPKKKRS